MFVAVSTEDLVAVLLLVGKADCVGVGRRVAVAVCVAVGAVSSIHMSHAFVSKF